MQALPFERERMPPEAAKIIQKTITQLNLSCEVREQYDAAQTSHVALTCEQNATEFCGSGKGEYHEIGAQAEALEHWFTETQSPDDCSYLLGGELKKIGQSINDPLLASLGKYSNEPILCIGMESFKDRKIYQIPVQLINPDIALGSSQYSDAGEFLSRYSTNSGTALGLSRNEALIHSVNELIERHILSEMMVSIVLKQQLNFSLLGNLYDDYFSKLVDADLACLVPDAWVISKVGVGGIHFCCVVEKTDGRLGTLAKMSSGASTSARHAMSRAITEFMQTIVLQDDSTEHEDAITLSLLNSAPKLHALIACSEVATFPKSAVVPENETNSQTVDEIAAQHCKSFLEHRGGLIRFSAVGYEGVQACQCYVPGLERFHLIRSGNPVAPMRIFEDA